MKHLLHYLRYDWPLHFILILLNWLPDNVIFLKLRGWLARPFLGECGTNLEIGRHVTFHNPSNLRIGKSVFIAYGCMFLATDMIIVEDEVMFGPYCVIVSGNHGYELGSYRFGHPELAPIVIRKGTWVGSHAVITAGSDIGKSCLIGAGAVVVTDINDHTIAGGIPAKPIKSVVENELPNTLI